MTFATCFHQLILATVWSGIQPISVADHSLTFRANLITWQEGYIVAKY